MNKTCFNIINPALFHIKKNLKILIQKSLFAFLCLFALSVETSFALPNQLKALIARHGQPTVVNHLSNGNTVYLFSVYSLKSFKPPAINNPTVIVGPGGKAIAASVPSSNQVSYNTIGCTIMIETNKKDEIIRRQQEGSGC